MQSDIEPVINRNHHYYYCGSSGTWFNNNHGHYNTPSSSDLENHWCETCDRGFKSTFLLEKHIKEHMTCSIDGCQFVAHPKVITKHIQMQHSTGLYNKIGNLNNPEAIFKWREERRKRYPTKENIEKKNATLKEKVERGEKMGLKYSDRRDLQKGANFKRKNDLDKPNMKRKFGNNKARKPRPQGPQHVVKCESRKLKPFQGIQRLIQDEYEEVNNQEDFNIPIEDDEIDTETSIETLKLNNSAVCNALSSLIMNYESSEDEESTPKSREVSFPDIIQEVTNTKILSETVHNNTENSKVSNDYDSGPEEVKTEKYDSNVPSPVETKSKCEIRHKNKVRISNQRLYKRPKLPSTLLEKLLNNEIKHERNVTLQCIRFITKNNFFLNVLHKKTK